MKIPTVYLLCVLAMALPLNAEIDSDSTLTRVGQEAPAFECVTLAGKKVDLKNLRGKVVLINFFATWCGPCMAEMPHLEKEVWQQFKDKDFVLLALGREHENKELTEFPKKSGVTFAIAGDPKRKIYSQFATQYIPRNYVIDADGKIVFQSVGYEKTEFAKMVGIIQKELDKKSPGEKK